MKWTDLLNPKAVFAKEPVMVMTVIKAGVALAIAFGLNLTTEQREAIFAFAGAVIALGWMARSRVTPV